MKVISVCNEKGGVGKTTLAFNLAGACVAKGLKVLLVDEEPRLGCMGLASSGNAGFDVVVPRRQ